MLFSTLKWSFEQMSSDAEEGENSEEEENEWMKKELSKETSKHYEKKV